MARGLAGSQDSGRSTLARREGSKVAEAGTLIKEIEEQIADLKARWPAHSVPPSMWRELEELEEKLEEAKREPVPDA